MIQIDWIKLKESYTLEDFVNILEINQPRIDSKLYSEWDSILNLAYFELYNKNGRPLECERLIDNIIEFLKEQKRINMRSFIYPILESEA